MQEHEPIELPEQLRESLRDRDYTCLSIRTDQGTAYVLKVPRFEIERCRGTLPVRFHHHLYLYPTAPVIRTLIVLHDQPRSSLLVESFVNVADPEQHTEFASLARQPHIFLLFYDEHTEHRLSKQVTNLPNRMILTLLTQAESYYQSLPPGQFDFDSAKTKLMQQHRLTDYGKG